MKTVASTRIVFVLGMLFCLFSFQGSAANAAVTLGSYINDPLFSPPYPLGEMGWDRADLICKENGFRLPTVREVAELGLLRGAEIRETAFPSVPIGDVRVAKELSQMQANGFKPMFKHLSEACNNDFHYVDFYYSNTHYKSSAYVNPIFTSSCPDTFSEGDGYIAMVGEPISFARCVVK